MNRKYLVTVVVFFASQWAFSADLVQSLLSATGIDPTFAAARHTRIAGKENKVQALANLLPQITLSGSTTLIDQKYAPGKEVASYRIPTANAWGDVLTTSIDVAQPLYQIRQLVEYDARKKNAVLAEVIFLSAEQDLIIRVATAYFDVIKAEERIKQTIAFKEAAFEELEKTKKLFELGFATITDIDEAKAKYDDIIAQEIGVINDRAVKQETYQQLTGLDPISVQPVTEDIKPDILLPTHLLDWYALAEQSNAKLIEASLKLDIFRRRIDLYRAETSPELRLVGKYQSEWTAGSLSGSGGRDRTNKGQIGLALTIPLYTGGNRSSLFRQTVAEMHAQQDTVKAIRQAVLLATKVGFLATESGIARIKAYEQALISAKSQVDSTTVGRQVGMRTTIDVLNAQQKYYTTRYNLAEARCNYLLARLQLAQAVGKLGEKEVQEVNRWIKK